MNAITLAFMRAGHVDATKKFLNATTKYSGWSFNGSYKTFQALKAQGKIA